MKKLLTGDETYNLAPIEYGWAWKMSMASMANHWTPQSISMGNDKACYESSLTLDERHMFINVFASLTTSDMAINENLMTRIVSRVKPAEVRLYLSRQISEEGLHSMSYQHVIESLGLDQKEVYTRYQTVPEIKQFFDFMERETTGRSVTDSEFVELLILYYAFWEGVFFPTAFASIYALQRRNLMKGTAEQIQYINRDEVTHIAFGTKLINSICDESPAWKPSEGKAHKLFRAAMNHLDLWADYCIPAIIGYNADMHQRHARYLADRRLAALGYDKIWGTEEVLPWLDAMASLKKEKNFFETHVTEYQTGSSLDFGNDSIDDITNWR